MKRRSPLPQITRLFLDFKDRFYFLFVQTKCATALYLGNCACKFVIFWSFELMSCGGSVRQKSMCRSRPPYLGHEVACRVNLLAARNYQSIWITIVFQTISRATLQQLQRKGRRDLRRKPSIPGYRRERQGRDV